MTAQQPFSFTRLRLPIVQAPMAGGVSTPALAAAVSGAGGLGFLAAGYQTPDRVRAEIAEVRRHTSAPFGVNIFVPGPPADDQEPVQRYRAALAAEADRYGVPLGEPPVNDDDSWADKLDLVRAERVPVVSFTFGCPSPEAVRDLRAAGSYVIITVTTVDEARTAASAGADALCVQGAEAGAHRGSFPPVRQPDETIGLLPLLAMVSAAVDLPLVATGGITGGRSVAAVLAAGAVAAQLGTAFIRTPESGAYPAHKAALVDPRYARTQLTLAFTGRPARALSNRLMDSFGPLAPPSYPQVHHVTRPLRAAAAARGDLDGMALWAGQGHELARELPAAELVGEFAEEAADAARALADRLSALRR